MRRDGSVIVDAASRDIWVVAEGGGARFDEVVIEALCDAREQAGASGSVSVAVMGSAGEAELEQLARYGADRILCASGARRHSRSAERAAAVLGPVLDREPPRLVLLGATAWGREVAGRLAAARRLPVANNCNWVRLSHDGAVEAARLVYGGKLYARLRMTAAPALATLRPGAAGVGKPAPRRPSTVELPPLDGVSARVEHVGFTPADPRTVDIAEAERIVALGRGIGSQAQIEMYERLAELLGASLASSRPLVDAGWLPFERQVGQTGRIVSPRLYIAAGISGASHHTLGMKGAECVVAINRDKNAEIFKLADLKVAADLDQIVPALLREIDAKRAA